MSMALTNNDHKIYSAAIALNTLILMCTKVTCTIVLVYMNWPMFVEVHNMKHDTDPCMKWDMFLILLPPSP